MLLDAAEPLPALLPPAPPLLLVADVAADEAVADALLADTDAAAADAVADDAAADDVGAALLGPVPVMKRWNISAY